MIKIKSVKIRPKSVMIGVLSYYSLSSLRLADFNPLSMSSVISGAFKFND
jgi:hypothetical protein